VGTSGRRLKGVAERWIATASPISEINCLCTTDKRHRLAENLMDDLGIPFIGSRN